jgi:hypothetical protein
MKKTLSSSLLEMKSFFLIKTLNLKVINDLNFGLCPNAAFSNVVSSKSMANTTEPKDPSTLPLVWTRPNRFEIQ